MKLLEINIIANKNKGFTEKIRYKVAINTDFISNIGPCHVLPKHRSFIKMKDCTFLDVLAPYGKLLEAIREDLNEVPK